MAWLLLPWLCGGGGCGARRGLHSRTAAPRRCPRLELPCPTPCAVFCSHTKPPRCVLCAPNRSCMLFKDVMAGVANGTCDAGLGAVTVSTMRAEAGYRFSYPTYSASLAVMVAVEVGWQAWPGQHGQAASQRCCWLAGGLLRAPAAADMQRAAVMPPAERQQQRLVLRQVSRAAAAAG